MSSWKRLVPRKTSQNDEIPSAVTMLTQWPCWRSYHGTYWSPCRRQPEVAWFAEMARLVLRGHPVVLALRGKEELTWQTRSLDPVQRGDEKTIWCTRMLELVLGGNAEVTWCLRTVSLVQRSCRGDLMHEDDANCMLMLHYTAAWRWAKLSEAIHRELWQEHIEEFTSPNPSTPQVARTRTVVGRTPHVNPGHTWSHYDPHTWPHTIRDLMPHMTPCHTW